MSNFSSFFYFVCYFVFVVYSYYADFTSQALSMSIYGLGNMGINWVDNVPVNTKNALLLAISKNIAVPLTNDKNLKNLNKKAKSRISTNENLKINSNLDVDLNKNMKIRINTHEGVDDDDDDDDSQRGMTLQGLSNILYGLSSMNLMWGDLASELRDQIITILIFLLRKSMHQKPNTQIIPKFVEKKSDSDSIWKNKNKGAGRTDISSNIDDNNNGNVGVDNKISDSGLSIETLDIINSTDFRFLLNSMALIKFDFSDSNSVDVPSSQSSALQLKAQTLKEILLTLFIQFASHDDMEDTVRINHDGDDNYRILNNKLFHKVMKIKDFFVCVKSIGERRERLRIDGRKRMEKGGKTSGGN